MPHPALPAAPVSAAGAVALALGQAGLPAALGALLGATGLTGAQLRRTPADGGEVLATAGLLAPADLLELTVRQPGPAAVPLAVLVVAGEHPPLLDELRAAAAVLGLALAAEVARGVVERDRELLADRMHDGALQELLVARLAADAAVRGGRPEAARDAVQDALVGLRRLLWHVRPRAAATCPRRSRALSARLVEVGALPVRVLGALAAPGLEPAVAAAAYRVVQAVALDAGPLDRAVTVALRPDPARPGVVVLDVDGGVALADPQHWRDRLRGVGGELDPLPEGGDRLRVVLPLAARPSCAPPALLRRPAPLAVHRLPTADRTPTSKAMP